MTKRQLRKLIKEEIQTLSESSVSNMEVLKFVDELHSLIDRIKKDPNIDKSISRKLYSESSGLVKLLHKIVD